METLKRFRVFGTENAVPMVKVKGHYYEIDGNGNLHFFVVKEEQVSRTSSFANLLWWGVIEETEES